MLHSDLPADLSARIRNYAAIFDELPAVVIIHHIIDGSVLYMSKRGLSLLNTTFDEIANLPHDVYHKRYFNEEDAKDYAPKLFALLNRNNDEEMISHFQQVQLATSDSWTWHLSSVKIFHWDSSGKPLAAIALAMPIDKMHHMSFKAGRLLEENNFLRKNIQKFNALTEREKQILKLTTIGKSASEIAAELSISTATAATHRRNLKNKLGANSNFDLMQYATAFNLV